MEGISDGLNEYIVHVSQIGAELGPMVVRAMIMLLIMLLLVKYLGRFVAAFMVKAGMPERRAAYTVTVLHILVILAGALVVLNLVGVPGVLLLQVVMVIVLIFLALFIIARPYLPRLPFERGDIIRAGGSLGIVDRITVIHTRLRTFDGKTIYIPNHKILNDQVTNSSQRPNRRIEIEFFIPYDQDLKKVREVVGKILKEDERVLEKPAPRVVIARFSPNFLEMQARFWVERKHALTGRWEINEKIKTSFDEADIAMAAPRLEITSTGV